MKSDKKSEVDPIDIKNFVLTNKLTYIKTSAMNGCPYSDFADQVRECLYLHQEAFMSHNGCKRFPRRDPYGPLEDSNKLSRIIKKKPCRYMCCWNFF